MSRTRMEWDWINQYPIFVYTTFVSPKVFDVKIIKGEKNNQNAKGYGPRSNPWIEYTSRDREFKNSVVLEAFRRAEILMES